MIFALFVYLANIFTCLMLILIITNRGVGTLIWYNEIKIFIIRVNMTSD